jgi:hypothetical protein
MGRYSFRPTPAQQDAICVFCERPFRFNPGKSKGLFCAPLCAQRHRAEQYRLRIVQSGNLRNSYAARNFLLGRDGNVCTICRLTEWMGAPIPLVCDHINGNSDDWSIENCRMICCNCDAQTPTYKNKNRGNGRFARRERARLGLSY